MLRVAMVCPYSVSVPGGVQAQALGLARTMRELGHEVRVLAPCDGPPPTTFVTPLGASLPTSSNGSVAPLAPDPSAALRTIRALNDEAFDVVHLHEPLVPGPTATALLMQMAPTLGTFHAAGDPDSYRWLTRTARWAADHLTRRVVVSEAARELAERHLGGTYTVLYNGIETERFRRPSVPREDRPTIFFCGRYEPRKGLEVLLESLDHLPATLRNDVVLWVASEGVGLDAVRARHRDDRRIEWLGRVDDEEKIERLARCTAFCAPSLHGESFGIVLLEAMAAGAPLVAADIDGYRQVARHGESALLSPPGDAPALAAHLASVLNGDTMDLVEGGLRRAEEFSMARLAESYLGIYAEMLEEEPPPVPSSGLRRLAENFGEWVPRRARSGERS